MAGLFDQAAPKNPALEGGSAVRPRIMSDAFSPIIIVGALRFPLTIDGMMELSTTRRPLHSVDPALRIDDRHRVVSHAAGAAGVVGALGRFPDHRVNLGIVACGGPGPNRIAAEGVEGALRHDPPAPGGRRFVGRRGRADRRDS